MIRLLDGLVLLKEIDCIKEAKYSSAELKKLYPEKIVVIRHTSYIYRDVLCYEVKKKITPLDNYIQLGEFADFASINKSLFSKRVKFMKKTGVKLFEYLSLADIHFIKLDNEFKHLLQNYQPFLANLQDYELEHCKLIGDLKIGFY